MPALLQYEVHAQPNRLTGSDGPRLGEEFDLCVVRLNGIRLRNTKPCHSCQEKCGAMQTFRHNSILSSLAGKRPDSRGPALWNQTVYAYQGTAWVSRTRPVNGSRRMRRSLRSRGSFPCSM